MSDMEVVEDEADVVFEGSELHRHLVEVGHAEDVEVVRPVDLTRPISEILLAERTHTWYTKMVKMFSPRALQKILTKMALPVTCLYKNNPKQKQPLLDIWKCPLLLDEDKKWIYYGDSCCMSLHSTKATFSPEFWTDLYGTSLGIILSGPFKVVVAASAVVWYGRYRTYLKNGRKVRYLTDILPKLIKQNKLALYLIQDRERIDRGYMMTCSGGSFLDKDTTKTLPGLRATIAQVLQKAIFLVSESTKQFRELHPLKGHTNDACHYMATTVWGDANDNNRESLIQLKKDSLLLVTLVSELLRRLALCFCPAMWVDHSNLHTSNQVYTLCYNLAEELSELYQKLFSEAFIAFNVFIPDDPNPYKKKEGAPSQLVDFGVAVHSAAVHTKALSEVLLDCEQVAITAPSSANEPLIESLEIKCAAAKTSLRSIENCIDVAERLTVKLKQASECTRGKKAKKSEETDASLLANNPAIVSVGHSDLNVCAEDLEVFEAVSNNEEGSRQPGFDDDEEVAVKRRVEQEVTRRLFVELKDVLAVRAKEMEEREARNKPFDVAILFEEQSDSDAGLVDFIPKEKETTESESCEYSADEEDCAEDNVALLIPPLVLPRRNRIVVPSSSSSSSQQDRPIVRATGDSDLTDLQWYMRQMRINRLDEEDYVYDSEEVENLL